MESRYSRLPARRHLSAARQPSSIGVLISIHPLSACLLYTSDPHASQISQRVLARGAFGDMEISLHFLPSPNKRSSYMAILGAISSLKKYASPVKLGY